MKELTFVTGNLNKFHTAHHVLQTNGIKLIQASFDIDEIQSEDTLLIAKDKAHKAFDILKQPILVNDDSWSIHGLNGFPGPYMKSINRWFSPDDFLHLTQPLKDRRVTLSQITVYQDEQGQKIFTKEIPGQLLKEISTFPGIPWMKIVSITKDGRSLAEVRETNPEQLATENDTVWNEVSNWLIKTKKQNTTR